MSNHHDSALAPRKDVPLIITSIVVVGTIVAALTAFRDQAKTLADQLFTQATTTFGSVVQLLGFFCVLLIVGLAFSKYGNIRFGSGKPEYGNTSWVFMFICAGLGSATMYWAFMEWAYYYLTPGLGIAGSTPQALDYSIAYSFFHWGSPRGKSTAFALAYLPE
ncbi:BCCT family transporter [Pseudomonas putida]|nr:BCCT family transporter [Pseudomonas putida]